MLQSVQVGLWEYLLRSSWMTSQCTSQTARPLSRYPSMPSIALGPYHPIYFLPAIIPAISLPNSVLFWPLRVPYGCSSLPYDFTLASRHLRSQTFFSYTFPSWYVYLPSFCVWDLPNACFLDHYPNICPCDTHGELLVVNEPGLQNSVCQDDGCDSIARALAQSPHSADFGPACYLR